MTGWRPSAGIDMLRQRAQMLAAVRDFFAQRAVLEVDVPVLAHAAVTDPNIESFQVRAPSAGEQYWLMTSPEFYLKRLLAAGSGPVYYLGRAFRAGDRGSHHQPEFCMLEWYRSQWSAAQLMSEVAELAALFVPGEIRHCSYRDVFLQHTGVDPHTASLAVLRDCARAHIDVGFDCDEHDVWLDLLFSHCVQPQLCGKVFVQDFPASQAALAQTRRDEYGNNVAARFELYINGVEIANGYQEELDAAVLAERFADNLALRAARGQTLPPLDEPFLAAMRAGMPPCAGVALGVDRLLMVATGSSSLAAVLPFAL